MSRELRTLVMIDLVQDADVLLPVLERLNATPGFRVQIAVSRWLARSAPRIPRLLRRHGLAFHYVDRSALLSGKGPSLDGVDLLLTASESSAGPHRWMHAVVQRAIATGVRTATLQHGLDNLGLLTRPADVRAHFASERMFCWPPVDALPPGLESRDRTRLICVGRPSSPLPRDPPEFDLGVFENLHARVHTHEERALVLARILGLALARPALRIYVQTHPAGGWLDRAADRLAAAGNITYLPSAAARRALQPSRNAVARVARVIATPSTVVLDAAQASRPVALALDGGPLYAPIPLLRGLEDWISFADGAATPGPHQAEFLARHLAPGDATARIIAQLAASQIQSPCAHRSFA